MPAPKKTTTSSTAAKKTTTAAKKPATTETKKAPAAPAPKKEATPAPKSNVKTVLVLGSGPYGQNLEKWAKEFPDATIEGWSSTEASHPDYKIKRIAIDRLDLIQKEAAKEGYDVIVYEYSPLWRHQIDTFNALWPKTNVKFILTGLESSKSKVNKLGPIKTYNGSEDLEQAFPALKFGEGKVDKKVTKEAPDKGWVATFTK